MFSFCALWWRLSHDTDAQCIFWFVVRIYWPAMQTHLVTWWALWDSGRRVVFLVALNIWILWVLMEMVLSSSQCHQFKAFISQTHSEDSTGSPVLMFGHELEFITQASSLPVVVFFIANDKTRCHFDMLMIFFLCITEFNVEGMFVHTVVTWGLLYNQNYFFSF